MERCLFQLASREAACREMMQGLPIYTSDNVISPGESALRQRPSQAVRSVNGGSPPTLIQGPALVTTKDAGGAITLLQSLTGSTFDNSQLVLTACMGFFTVTKDKLKELRVKYRPAILEAAEERSRGEISKESKGLATKLDSFKHDRRTPKKQTNGEDNKLHDANLSHLDSTNLDNFF